MPITRAGIAATVDKTENLQARAHPNDLESNPGRGRQRGRGRGRGGHKGRGGGGTKRQNSPSPVQPAQKRQCKDNAPAMVPGAHKSSDDGGLALGGKISNCVNKQRTQDLAFEVHSTTALTNHQSTGHEAQAGKQENAALPNSGGSDQQSEGSELVMVPLKSTAAQRAKALKNAQDRHTARQAIVNCARNLPAIFEEDNEDGGIEVKGGGNSIHESERGDVRPAQQNQDDALLSKASDPQKEEQEPSPSVCRTAKWVHSGLQSRRASIEAEMNRIRATSNFVMEQEKKLDELTAQLEDLGTLVVETIE